MFGWFARFDGGDSDGENDRLRHKIAQLGRFVTSRTPHVTKSPNHISHEMFRPGNGLEGPSLARKRPSGALSAAGVAIPPSPSRGAPLFRLLHAWFLDAVRRRFGGVFDKKVYQGSG